MRYLYLSLIVATYVYGENMKDFTSFHGFRGAINTPNSEVMEEGEFEFLYTNQIENLAVINSSSRSYSDNKSQDNFFLNMGFLPNLDLNFQYAYAVDDEKNDYFHGELRHPDNNYLNNRTIGLKYKIPFIPKDLFSLALGIEDIAGGNRYLGSKYIVASKEFDGFRTSLGFAQGDNSYSLDGIFGSVEYQPFSWLQLAGEYDSKDWNAALKSEYSFNVSKQKINLGVMAKSSLDEKDIYFGLYANMPFNDKSLAIKKKFNKLSSKLTLDDLKLSNSSYQLKDDEAYFEYENDLYVYNDIDTLGVVLGILSTTTKSKKIKVAIKKANIIQYIVEVNTQEYKQFLVDGKYHSNLLQFKRGTQEELTLKHSDRFKPTLTLRPDVVIIDGSEYSDVIDYTVAMQAELSMRLAKGTILSGRYNIPLDMSFNFEDEGIFSYRNRNKTSASLDQVLLSQYMKFDTPYPWVSLFQVGRFDEDLEGFSFESGISDLSGRHHLLVKASKLDDNQYSELGAYADEKREEKLLSYRYYLDDFNSNIKLTAGEFLYGDKGESISLERYFSDISLRFDLARTEHDRKGDNNLFKLTLSIPFGTQKYLRTDYLNLKGGEFTYNKRKNIVSGGDASYALPHHLKEVDNSFTVENYYLNRDRFHPAYIKANHNRLRNIFIDSK